MKISTFARRAGISPSGVRWYEAAGVLPSPVRRENGYREYSDADLSRLTLILALRRLGLTPVEAGRLVDRCLEGKVTDPALTATLEEQRLEAFRATRADPTARLKPFDEIARRAAGILPAVSISTEKGA